jgi:hypothetical protein
LHEQINLDEYTMSKVQFYVSRDIVLHRDVGSTDTEIEQGKIRLVNGRQVEEVVIPAGTPGIMMSMPSSEQLAISFEATTDDALVFGVSSRQAGAFSLQAKDWSNRVGSIEYGGKTYRTSPESAGAILLVDVRKLNKSNKRTRTATGRTVGS